MFFFSFNYFTNIYRTVPFITPGFNLIEWLVLVAMIGILVSMLMPVLAKARESFRRTNCQSNLLMFGVFMFAFVFVHQRHFDDPTPVSRLDVLNALVRDGKFEIDRYHENTTDKAFFENHYYSDKAPGTLAVTMLPFYASVIFMRSMDMDLDSRQAWLVASWISCALGLAPITSLGAVAMFHWLRRSVDVRSAWFTTVAVYLGAAPLPYCTMMFSHAMVVGFLSIALWAVTRLSHLETGTDCKMKSTIHVFEPWGNEWVKRNRRVFHSDGWYRMLAGFALGFALASEFTCGVVVVALSVCVGGRSARAWGQLLLGSFFPVALIPLYNVVTVGDPMTLPYSHQAVFQEMQAGLYAIGWPDLETAFRLLFGSARGLFFWSPFLLMAGVGWGWRGSQRAKQWLLLFYFIPLLQMILISGRVWDWQAGYTLGPRYLAPILPLLALPCAMGFRRFPRLGTYLLLVSFLMTLVATSTNACPRYDQQNPLFQIHLPALIKGEFSHFLTGWIGWHPKMSFFFYLTTLSVSIYWLSTHLQSMEDGSDDLSSNGAVSHRNI